MISIEQFAAKQPKSQKLEDSSPEEKTVQHQWSRKGDEVEILAQKEKVNEKVKGSWKYYVRWSAGVETKENYVNYQRKKQDVKK